MVPTWSFHPIPKTVMFPVVWQDLKERKPNPIINVEAVVAGPGKELGGKKEPDGATDPKGAGIRSLNVDVKEMLPVANPDIQDVKENDLQAQIQKFYQCKGLICPQRAKVMQRALNLMSNSLVLTLPVILKRKEPQPQAPLWKVISRPA